MNRTKLLFLLLTWLNGAEWKVFAQPITVQQLDNLVQRNRSVFQVPGIAVGIIKDGKLLVSKGYGVRSLQTKQPVTTQTLFGIASNTKAFTAAAIALLVDEGKLRWDDRVNQYLPGFRLYDSLASQQLTIRDLLSHRSGLPNGVGDLMHDPDSTDFTLEEILYNQRYIKPSSSFRSQFAYSNNGYLVAGAIIAQVAGVSWEEFIEQRILRPLGMQQSAASYQACRDNPNLIDAHKLLRDSVRVVTRYGSMKVDAAGGVYTNIEEMSKWVLMLLNRGKYGPHLTKQLLSEAVIEDLFTPQVIIPVHQPGIYRTHFAAYGLGWFLSDVRGYKEIVHSGQDVGMVSEVAMLPELGLGVIVFTNSESGAASVITDQIIDSYLGILGEDQTAAMQERVQRQERTSQSMRDSVWQQAARQTPLTATDLQRYVGTYQDIWLGRVVISLHGHQLWFASQRSLQLRGFMRVFGPNQFVLKWQNPELDDGVFVQFNSSPGERISGFSLQAIIPNSSYSDLHFQRVKD